MTGADSGMNADSGIIPVFVNPNGGTAARHGAGIVDEVERAFAAAGLRAGVALVAGCDMADAIGRVANAPVVVVGGGDGTLGCAAGALLKANGKAALGILPFGTRNHLAGELGIPADIAGVARLIASEARRAIDVGRVNGHIFVNNASIGLYPAMVRRRDAVQRRTRLPKWLANLPAAWTALKRARHHRLRLVMDGTRRTVRTPMLFVGNNRYALDLAALGRRARLDEGVLSVFAVGPSSRAGLIGFALRTVARSDDAADDYAALGATASFDVAFHDDMIAVALDGEVVRIAGPLRFRCDAGALTVVAPPAA